VLYDGKLHLPLLATVAWLLRTVGAPGAHAIVAHPLRTPTKSLAVELSAVGLRAEVVPLPGEAGVPWVCDEIGGGSDDTAWRWSPCLLAGGGGRDDGDGDAVVLLRLRLL